METAETQLKTELGIVQEVRIRAFQWGGTLWSVIVEGGPWAVPQWIARNLASKAARCRVLTSLQLPPEMVPPELA